MIKYRTIDMRFFPSKVHAFFVTPDDIIQLRADSRIKEITSEMIDHSKENDKKGHDDFFENQREWFLVLAFVIDLLCDKNISNAKEVFVNIYRREKVGSTGIGRGVGGPHTKTRCISEPKIAFINCTEGYDFDTLDGEPMYSCFLQLSPNDSFDIHLFVHDRISRILLNTDFRGFILNCKSAEEMVEILEEV